MGEKERGCKGNQNKDYSVQRQSIKCVYGQHLRKTMNRKPMRCGGEEPTQKEREGVWDWQEKEKNKSRNKLTHEDVRYNTTVGGKGTVH